MAILLETKESLVSKVDQTNAKVDQTNAKVDQANAKVDKTSAEIITLDKNLLMMLIKSDLRLRRLLRKLPI